MLSGKPKSRGEHKGYQWQPTPPDRRSQCILEGQLGKQP